MPSGMGTYLGAVDVLLQLRGEVGLCPSPKATCVLSTRNLWSEISLYGGLEDLLDLLDGVLAAADDHDFLVGVRADPVVLRIVDVVREDLVHAANHRDVVGVIFR